MYTIYALKFENGKIYIGMTTSLKRRIREHKRGKTNSTKNKKIIGFIKIEECADGISAREREKYWKSGCGREKLKYSGVEQSGSSRGS